MKQDKDRFSSDWVFSTSAEKIDLSGLFEEVESFKPKSESFEISFTEKDSETASEMFINQETVEIKERDDSFVIVFIIVIATILILSLG